MNEASDADLRRKIEMQQAIDSQGWSRREFLRQLGKGGAVTTLAMHASLSWSPAAARAETAPPTSTDELIYASATALAKAIRAKKVSSVEVIEAHLKRIEAINPKLNAVVQLTADTARAEAQAADAALARGDITGPLHGVPVTIKDNIEMAGRVCTVGTKGRTSFIPTQDATVVTRLRAAGAVVLGKTNLPELGLAFESDNLIYGRTNNPYDLSRTPGGSSGGEAAIIAFSGPK
jgi:amidase